MTLHYLQPYSQREAVGQAWMKDLNDGAYRAEFYYAHIGSFSRFKKLSASRSTELTASLPFFSRVK